MARRVHQTPPAPLARAPRPRTPSWPPTDPEIETYLEIEADLPPESGVDPDLESELALNIALSGDLEALHESVSITIEEEGLKVTETVTETSTHTLTLTVTEPLDDEDDDVHARAITADDAATVSGTISIPEDGPPRRAKRRSGLDD